MRIDIHAINLTMTGEMRRCAETRVWQAVQRWGRRVSWVGLWLVRRDEPDQPPFACRLDAWVRGVGIVAVRYADGAPAAAIDIAAARLQQALERRLAGQVRDRVVASGSSADGTAGMTGTGASAWHGRRRQALPADAPRLAVVIERANRRGGGGRLSAGSWLKQRYGLDQISRIALPAHLWHLAADGAGLAEALRERLALSLLCWPELIVVLGRVDDGDDDPQTIGDEQDRVRRIVAQLRDWRLPVRTIGLWIAETCDDALGPVESTELATFLPTEVWVPRDRRRDAPAAGAEPSVVNDEEERERRQREALLAGLAD